jgi:putative hydrolase of the HAD superfamily
MTEENLNDLVDLCYNAWVQERHDAAERHLFPNAVETMERLRLMYPTTTFAAITNGAGCPLKMTSTLAPYFDFRVSGEDDDVFPHRKPHPFIYEYSVEKHKKLQSTNKQNSNLNGVWCHVGDCLANDVGASADCGAKTIWMCLEDNPDSAAARLLTDARNTPIWSTATAEEIQKRALQVQQGRTKVGATIGSLAELPDAVSKILPSANTMAYCKKIAK